jgi:hypothetical protein
MVMTAKAQSNLPVPKPKAALHIKKGKLSPEAKARIIAKANKVLKHS